jgi:RNA polymerase sigma-70 factor (ECF subfamily)
MGPVWDVRSESGFMACYRATFAEVYRYAAMLCGTDRAAAEDLVHDVYLGALQAAKRGAVREISVGYLTVAARHRFLDRVRSAAREERRLRLVTSVEPADEVRAIPTLLADLPDRERTAMVLRHVDDMTVSQIAEAMGVSVQAAESLLARAARRLRNQEVRDA